MFISMEKRTHKSQFEYGGLHADDRPLFLSTRDEKIFRLLDPEHGYHYLPSNWIHAFVGGDELRVAKRLGRLARDPHGFLDRRQDWYKHGIYSRTTKADIHLGERRARDRDPFAHRLLEDLVQASIALGLKSFPDLQLIPWLDLVATGKIPKKTIESSEPHAIPLASGKLIPDGRPFAIKHGTAWRFILGKEIDRGTEPLSSGHARRSIRQKFEHYAECFSNKLYTRHYGFPNSIVLFITTSPRRMASMMELCGEVIGPCNYLLFAHSTDWANAPRFPPPNGDMLGPFERVGHPPFNLATFGIMMFGKSKNASAPLGFDELLDRKRQIDLEIAGRQDTEVDNLKAKVIAVTNALGISVAELFGIKGEAEPRRRKQAPRVKYRDPDQRHNTWTGRGKPPKWMQEKLDQGAVKEQFQV